MVLLPSKLILIRASPAPTAALLFDSEAQSSLFRASYCKSVTNAAPVTEAVMVDIETKLDVVPVARSTT
ncbi:hypothetical protein TSA6c_00655 [Azospirillum sp. TSA6c]|nr:hypothetical protein TSA6c_00655 [Azospirillum sp. TSA6c]